MYYALDQLTNYFDFLDFGNWFIPLVKCLYPPFALISSTIFLLSYETILVFKFLHPNLTWFLKVYKIILRFIYIILFPPIFNMLAGSVIAHPEDVFFYASNNFLIFIYCFIASRLVSRERHSRVWSGENIFGQFEERAGGFLSRKQFFIAVSKREYFAELAAVILSMNLCLLYWREHSPLFAAMVMITDIHLLAFLACTIVSHVPLRHSEGANAGPGIMLYKRGITREYIAVLKMQALDADVEADPKDKGIKEERMEGFMGFFRHQWYYILAQLRSFVSLNITVSEGSYEVFLVLRKRTVLTPSATALTDMNAALQQITTSINSTLDCQVDVLPQEQIPSMLGKLMFDAPVPRRIETPFLTRVAEPAMCDTAFRTQNGVITFLKLEIEKFVRSHPTQIINESTRLDSLIKALTSEKITARYMFSIKLAGIEKTELGEKDNPKQVVMTKVKHGFMEIERNFAYLVNSARVTAGLFVFSTTKEGHADAVEKVRGIIRSTWETNATSEKDPMAIAMHLACNSVESLIYHVPSLQLFRFCHLPRVPSGKQERRYQFLLDPPPDSVVAAGMLNIGKIMDPNGGSKDFMLGIDDIKRHVFINGTTGSGKSVFTRNLVEQLIDRFPTIPFLILELKGEYATLGGQYQGVKFLEPGINFSINIFNPVVDVHVHAERVFNIIKTSFDFADLKDFSPQMEKVLVDLIITTCSDPDPVKRSFAAFFQNAQAYVNNNKAKIPYLESTWIGIENRLRRITTGPLRSVFDGQNAQDPTEDIMRSRSVVSLASIVRLGGTKDDLYFVANLILEMVWGANLTRGPAKGISHVTFVDDAQYFSKTRGKAPVRETNFLEDIALLLRGTGEVLVAISTRPDISEDVLSNCGLIVCFQTKFKDDVQKLKGLLHLQEDKASFLEILPEHTCVIKLNSYPSPFTLETRKPFALASSSTNKLGTGVLAGRSEERRLPADYSQCAKFFAKVKSYYQLKDHAWNNFSTISKCEMEDLEKRILSLRDEIDVMLHDNKEIMVLVKNARTSRPPNVDLCKIHDELIG